MAWEQSLIDDALTHVGTKAVYAGLGYEGTEIQGEGYERVQVTWGSPATIDGKRAITAQGEPVINVPGNTDINEIHLYDAATSGTRKVVIPVTPESVGNPTTYRITLLRLTLESAEANGGF